MANQKISQLTAATTASGSDQLLLTQGGSSKSLTLDVFRSEYLEPALDIDQVPFTSITGTILANNVGDAIREVQNELIALDADSVAFSSVTGGLTANNVGDALRQLQDSLDADYISFSSATGGITATNVGDALRELQDEILDRPWQYNGTDIYYSGGNVGLGTSSPDGRLHVLKASAGAVTANSNSTLVLENSTTNYLTFLTPNTNVAGLLFGDTDSVSVGQLVYDHSVDRMQIVVNSGTRMTINSTGNTGIGTTSPDGRLHVHTASAGSVTADPSGDDLVVENSSGSGITILSPDASASNIYFGSPSNNIGAYFRWQLGSDLLTMSTNKAASEIAIKSSNGIEAIRIDSSQNVGISTSAPSQKLDVNDDSIRIRTAKTPASATDTGTQGQIAWDGNYVYVCTATNTWVRAALNTW